MAGAATGPAAAALALGAAAAAGKGPAGVLLASGAGDCADPQAAASRGRIGLKVREESRPRSIGHLRRKADTIQQDVSVRAGLTLSRELSASALEPRDGVGEAAGAVAAEPELAMLLDQITELVSQRRAPPALDLEERP